MVENLEKQSFTFFAFLPPLYLRFRLSRESYAEDLDEIYWLVSKTFNFMLCRSVFERFLVLYGLLLFAGAAGNDRQVPTYMARRNSYYSSAAIARTVARWVAFYRHSLILCRCRSFVGDVFVAVVIYENLRKSMNLWECLKIYGNLGKSTNLFNGVSM